MLALGKHVSEHETAIGGLIGISICRTMAVEQLETFVQQPDAPNLYWALTELPSRMIDLRKAMDIKAQIVELTFPDLKDVETARLTSAEWRSRFLHVARTLAQFQQWNADSPKEAELDGLIARYTPLAKVGLRERGWTDDKLAKLDPVQLILLEFVRRNDELGQEVLRTFHLSYPEYARTQAALEVASSTVDRQLKSASEPFQLPQLLGAAQPELRRATVRLDRQIAALRVIEALRLHAAANGGALPKSLDDVTLVPIPADPVSGKPFDYTLEKDTATLTGPELRNTPFKYELTMRKAK
ncbi:MAG: hypothetical protein QM811_04295 [Pirellulales bacterium]